MLLPRFRVLLAPEGGEGGSSSGGSAAVSSSGGSAAASAGESASASGQSGAESAAGSDSGGESGKKAARKGLNNSFLTSGDNAIQRARGKVNSVEDLKKLAKQTREVGSLDGKTVELDAGADADSPAKPEVEGADGKSERKRSRAKAGSAVSDPIEGEAVENEATEENAYTPNYKYRAYDEEHDIPERFRDLIKDPESEKEVHEVFQKLHGFDKVKQNYQQLDQSVRQELVPEINFYRQTRQDINDSLQRGDLFGALKKLNVPEEMVLRAVAERVRILDMPPEQRQMYEARVAAEERERESARQMQSLQERVQRSEQLAKQSALQSVLAREDVASISKTFDERFGKSGAFYQLVCDHGDLVYRRSDGKVDLTPEQAVMQVIQMYGLNAAAASSRTQQTPPPRQVGSAPQAPAPKPPGQPKIIPNVGSNTASTAKGRPEIKSVDDIVKERKLRFGR